MGSKSGNSLFSLEMLLYRALALFSSTAYGLDFSGCPVCLFVCVSERYREFGYVPASNQAENWVLASFLDEFRLGTIKLSVPADPRELG